MKTILYILLLLPPFNFIAQSIPCHTGYSPVMGTDGHCYLNSCWAWEAGVKVRKDSLWKKSDYKKKDTLTWFIQKTCTPIHQHNLIKSLGDGTNIYQHWQTKEYFRGIPNRCRCLSSGSLIETKKGKVPVQNIKKGDWVKTIDKGDTVFRKVMLTHRETVPSNHKIAHIIFSNGNEIKVSPTHPQLNYISDLSNLYPGDIIDGQEIKFIEYITYGETYTYDILPEGNTGSYWVNGIRLGSKLFVPEMSLDN